MRRGSWWRVIVALVAFLLWAPPSFVGLPFAALLFLAPGSRGEWTYALAGGIGTASAGLLVLLGAGNGRLGAVTSAYVVLVTATFVALVVLKRSGSLLRLGVRAVLTAMAATLVLMQIVWGPSGLGELRWEVTRNVSGIMRIVVAIMPQWFALYEPAVRFFTLAWPLMLGLQALAGLAIAWHLHRRTADLMPDREAPAGGSTPSVVHDAAPITT